MAPIILHHAEQSKRLLWLLEELKLPYEVKSPASQAASASPNSSWSSSAGSNTGNNTPSSTSQSPNGVQALQQPAQNQEQNQGSGIYNTIAQAVASSLKGALPPTHSPTIIDGNLTIRESGAIVEYLIEKYGKNEFTPRSYASKLDDTFFMHYAEGSFMPPLVLKQVFQTILEKSPFFVRPFTSIVANQICASFIDPANFNNFNLVDSYLKKDGGRSFFSWWKVAYWRRFHESAVTCGAFKPEEIPQSMQDYLKRLQARPAYSKVEEMLKAQASAGVNAATSTPQAKL